MNQPTPQPVEERTPGRRNNTRPRQLTYRYNYTMPHNTHHSYTEDIQTRQDAPADAPSAARARRYPDRQAPKKSTEQVARVSSAGPPRLRRELPKTLRLRRSHGSAASRRMVKPGMGKRLAHASTRPRISATASLPSRPFRKSLSALPVVACTALHSSSASCRKAATSSKSDSFRPRDVMAGVPAAEAPQMIILGRYSIAFSSSLSMSTRPVCVAVWGGVGKDSKNMDVALIFLPFV
ncbi:hypothetical protein TSOC_007444 [Tetrabaena socialis]|uniref:Uncharacterized protein n=1 Tax=Tetrabaena socialis TaxID=47790 RepID=A0A2J8A110_9CHLO|nr:hypothetical protein TSOC_007444 [Tetrabaena socialis]|eukprot:PNH06213.1 hypothetical protein TSOC_007444 [Tetrabaena socialis]